MKLDYIHFIKERISHRSYVKAPLSPEHREAVESFIQELTENPYTIPVRFNLIDTKDNQPFKLGTYGVIKRARTFFAGSVVSDGDDDALIAFGYSFEKVVIFAQSLGLGTCWLGGTFSRGSFAKAIQLKDDEIIPCISPIGIPLKSQTLLERIMRTAARSAKRKPWSELFYLNNFDTPLQKDQAGDFSEALDMVQIAPSASNKQPWRIVYDPSHTRFHFYLHTLNRYVGNKLGFKIQKIDIGIAMYHFEAAAVQLGFQGNWETKDPEIFIPHYHSGTNSYIITWTLNNKAHEPIISESRM
ncbi:MAG: nitroreductase [Bacteroidetes bacterium]|nr:nitroreductase [Bacteroidota bacterium]